MQQLGLIVEVAAFVGKTSKDLEEALMELSGEEDLKYHALS